MAKGTRAQEVKRMEESICTLKENSNRQAADMKSLTERHVADMKDLKQLVTTINIKYDQLATHLLLINEQGQEETSRVSKTPLGGQQISIREAIQTRYACLDFPHFNGENPNGWVYHY
ncbi:unnamed protein product [Ilex paraguariensis]